MIGCSTHDSRGFSAVGRPCSLPHWHKKVSLRRLATGLYSLAVVLLSHGLAAAAVIELLDRAAVDASTVIRLKDVARVSDADGTLRVGLEEIVLAPAPAAGRSTRLTYDDIRGRLLAHGVNLAGVEFRGRSQAIVTGTATAAGNATPAVVVHPSQAAEVKPPTPPRVSEREHQRAREVLQAAFRREYQPLTNSGAPLLVRCECRRDDVPTVLAAPSEHIRFDQPQLTAGGPHALTAWWVAADGEPAKVPVQIWVDAAPQALSVKHAVPKGYVLQSEDLTWVTVPGHDAGMNRLADIVGKETTRALRPGQPLQPRDVAAVPLVRAGDIVTVSVRRPGIVVRRHFKATTAGGLQEQVTLTAVDDPRVKVQAIVTGYHEAAIVGATPEPRDVFQDATGAIQFVPATEKGRAP
jgi:flagella basal body P-ring formation protein FlgA